MLLVLCATPLALLLPLLPGGAFTVALVLRISQAHRDTTATFDLGHRPES
ncbi:hypothetical protein RM844_12050 [Streptomyces sp. DSM 44915]|uniref:Uncharacterized protein n=1 Tax=Streptomyces chisholmiae TaxID=3075540 RepID=A0ABU2JQL2_9ACTN|nr:hypothetical protein [Streptomyces sp. DSM 44915]MDT0267021.1 hypothetical protein [Streptomyces sp. DSM 44915]